MNKADDIEILFPDQSIMIGGKVITVREFRYREGMEAAALARPFLASLREMFSEVGEKVAAADFDGIIAAHSEVWLKLVAMSCGRDVEWLAQLPDHEAMKIQFAFWGVNGNFFTRRLVFGAIYTAAVARQSHSPKSSPTSSAPDSGATTTTSPNDSPGDKSSDTTD